MFNKVLWAGPKTSARWFALGCRSLSDVVERDSKITDIQKIGIRYYDELTAGIKRTEVEQVEKIVREVCAEIGSDVIMQICGGYRRGNQNIKDIDLLFTRVSGYEGLLDDLVSRLTARGLLTHTCYYVKPSEGNASSLHEHYLDGNTGLDLFDKWLGVYRLNPTSNHYRLDLIVVPYECWAYGVLGWSGSTLFERSLRQYAENELGMHLSNHGLTIKATGQSIPAKTEEEIFAALKLEYRAPHERCC